VLVYLLTSLLGTIYAVVKVGEVWGRRYRSAGSTGRCGGGCVFQHAGSATTIYNDIDKIMLSRLADLSATGVYCRGLSRIDVTMTPVRSLAAAAYPQFFRKGPRGLAATYPYARCTDRQDLALLVRWPRRDCGCWPVFAPTFWELKYQAVVSGSPLGSH